MVASKKQNNMGKGKQRPLPPLPLTETGIDLSAMNEIMQECGHRLITRDDVVYINKILLWIAQEFDVTIPEIQVMSRKSHYIAMRFLVVYALIPSQRFTTSFIGALIGRKWCNVSHMRKERHMDQQRRYGFYAEKFVRILPLVEGCWDQKLLKNNNGFLIMERVEIKEIEVMSATKASDLRLFGERLLLALGHKSELGEIEKCLNRHYQEELAAEKSVSQQIVKTA